MNNAQKLIGIKFIHTAIWIFFNTVIAYMGYAVIVGNLNIWFWIGLAFVLLEGLVLLLFRWTCPLTLIARRYSHSKRDNFDIYLPEWIARNTKTIYTTLSILIVLIALFRLFYQHSQPISSCISGTLVSFPLIFVTSTVR